jgi:hypothetical protein
MLFVMNTKGSDMSKSDYLKAKISYLRLLIASAVIPAILLAFWLATDFFAIAPILRTCAIIALVILVIGAIRANYAIYRFIERLGECQ